MTIKRVTFEDRGQDLVWWEVDLATGRIVGARTRQLTDWADGRSAVDVETIAIGERPRFFGLATEPEGRLLRFRIVDIADAPAGGGVAAP